MIRICDRGQSISIFKLEEARRNMCEEPKITNPFCFILVTSVRFLLDQHIVTFHNRTKLGSPSIFIFVSQILAAVYSRMITVSLLPDQFPS